MTQTPETRNLEAPGAALYVLQIVAAQLSVLVPTVRSIVGKHRSIEVARNDKNGPNYEREAGDLELALDRLQTGELAVVVLRISQRGFRSALLMAPSIFGGRLSQWMAAIEFTAEDWRPIWDAALSERRASLVCLSIDDDLDLSDDEVSVQTFPWNESRLVAAAVRDAKGEWVVHENPSPSW